MDERRSGYGAAIEAAAVRDRSDRGRLRVSGRAPGRMLTGIVTCGLPGRDELRGPTGASDPTSSSTVRTGRVSYGAVLTPKGRMVTDLRLLRWDDPRPAPAASTREAASEVGPDRGGEAGLDPSAPPAGSGFMRGPAAAPGGDGDDEAFLLDVPPAGIEPLEDHFTRVLPPRFATAADVGTATGMLTVVGPEAPDLLAMHALGLRVEGTELRSMDEGRLVALRVGDGWLRVVRTAEVATPAFDVLAARPSIDALVRTLEGAGVPPLTAEAWEALRVERGRPAYGVDMDATTIPVEAGIDERAIDHGKGCYTGQEVIVRIRDRGHVNRRLRGLRFGRPPPEAGTRLFAPEVRGERPAGRVTSSVLSPRMGAIGLGYVRREVQPGERVRVGATEGAPAEVFTLEDGGWEPGGSR